MTHIFSNDIWDNIYAIFFFGSIMFMPWLYTIFSLIRGKREKYIIKKFESIDNKLSIIIDIAKEKAKLSNFDREIKKDE